MEGTEDAEAVMGILPEMQFREPTSGGVTRTRQNLASEGHALMACGRLGVACSPHSEVWLNLCRQLAS